MANEQPGPWAKELDDYLRAFSGAFLFGIPLLLTMETWWIGIYVSLWKLVIFVGIAFLANVMLVHFGGFKEETTLQSSFYQAIEAVAVGIVASTIVLAILNRIRWDTPLESVLGKIIAQTVPLSIGAAAAGALVARSDKSREGADGQTEQSPERDMLNDLGATIAGGVFIGFSIAPTEEVTLLAAELNYLHELGLILFSLAVTYIIVFESGFSPQRQVKAQHSPLQRPFTETVVAYVISLAVALISLYFFGQIKPEGPLAFVISQVLVLELPVTVGGAAGRLVI